MNKAKVGGVRRDPQLILAARHSLSPSARPRDVLRQPPSSSDYGSQRKRVSRRLVRRTPPPSIAQRGEQTGLGPQGTGRTVG